MLELRDILNYIDLTNEYTITGSYFIGGYTDESDIDIVVKVDPHHNSIINSLDREFGLSFYADGSASEDLDTESWKAHQKLKVELLTLF